MRSNPITSWSYDKLKQLTLPKNHRAIFDGFEYVWQSKINGVWSRHYILNFETLRKYDSYLLFNISRWSTEVNNRDSAMLLKQIKEERVLESQKRRELKKIVTIYKKPLKKLKKIEMILEVGSSIPNKEIYKAIGLSKTQFYNYISKIYKL